MKRSEMLRIMAYAFNDDAQIEGLGSDPSVDLLRVMDRILFNIERAGILPPAIRGVYDSTPTVTPTGNLDYSFKRGWEPEESNGKT